MLNQTENRLKSFARLGICVQLAAEEFPEFINAGVCSGLFVQCYRTISDNPLSCKNNATRSFRLYVW